MNGETILVNTFRGNGCYLKEPLVVKAVDNACSVESVTSDSSSEEELNEALPVSFVDT